MWQDIIITILAFCFSYALIPQVYHGFKEKKGTIHLQTSIITTIGVFTLSVTYITLGLFFSAIMMFINAVLWTTLLIQKIKYK
ncbi:hypothetical protein KAJ87_01845 [Candidatus Pacearchaeota archaeon]|nr:hypothetical protein [Candidatus Pacearchaeota archaeon]